MQYTEEEIKQWIKIQNNISPLLLPHGAEIEGFLASGGQGYVYFGLYFGHKAAIKIYYPGQNLERIEREVNALTEINCDEIVKLLWYGKITVFGVDLPIVITELVIGETLSTKIRRKPLSETETSIIILDTAKAIKEIWDKQKIVHRDIKPSNILIRSNGRACIIDLGVARHLEKVTLTATGFTWGTPGYFSPEQVKGVKQLTCKSDVFSLAVVALECGLGHHPTNGNQQVLLVSNFQDKLPLPILTWQIEPLLRKMFNPKANARPMPDEIIDLIKRKE